MATPGGVAAKWMTMNEQISEWINEWHDHWTLNEQINKSSQLGQNFSHEFWIGSYFIQSSNPYPQNFFLIKEFLFFVLNKNYKKNYNNNYNYVISAPYFK